MANKARLYDFAAGTKIQSAQVDAEIDQLIAAHNEQETDINAHKTAATLDHPDNSVTTAKIAASAVTTAKITDANVTTAKMANASVTTAKIADSNVTTTKIADLHVTTGKLADLAVTNAKLANATITQDKLVTGTLDNRYYTETEVDTKLSNIAGGQAYSFRSGATFPTTPAEHDVFVLTADQTISGVTYKAKTAYQYLNSKWMEFVNSSVNAQQSSLTHGTQIITTDQPTPMTVEMTGKTLVNLLGRDGNCESLTPFTLAGTVALSTTQKKSGSNSIKTTASGSSYAVKDYTYPLDTTKQYVVGCWVYVESFTSGSVQLRLYDVGATTNMRYVASADLATIGSWQFVYVKVPTSNTLVGTGFRLFVGSLSSTAVAYFDDIRIYEVSSTLYNAIGTTYTASTTPSIDTVLPYVDDMKAVNGAYIIKQGENLVDNSFGAWTSGLTLTNDGYLTKTNETSDAGYQDIDVIEGQTYTLSVLGYSSSETTNAKLWLIPKDKNGSTLSGSASLDFTLVDSATRLSASFTMPTGTAKARIYSTASSTTIYFKDVILNLGSTAKTFVPQNIDYLYVLNPDLGSDPLGTVYDTVDTAQGIVTRRLKTMDLEGSLGWVLGFDGTGWKHVYIPFTGLVNSQIVVKYDGKIISNIAGITGADQSDSQSGNIRISIADTDSGWLEAWTGTNITADWIKAYFNGWKYTGDGTTHTWASVVDGSASPTQTLAYVSANKAPNLIPYKLQYQLATTQEESVTHEGAVNLHEGGNQVEVGSAVIVREPVPTIQYDSTNKVYRINSVNPLNYRSEKILRVHRGMDDDKKWKIIRRSSASSSNGWDYAEIAEADYDTTAEYTVTYLALDKYSLTSNVTDATGAYQRNLYDVVKANTQNIADMGTEVSVIQGDTERRLLKGEGEKVQKGKDVEFIWGGSSTVNVNITFAKAFSEIPVILATARVYNNNIFATVDSVTTTGFTLRLNNRDTTAPTTGTKDYANWIAVGK
jgi:hypothetical protein